MVKAEELLDLDGNGFVEWSEFLAVALVALPGLSSDAELVITAFRLLNRHSSNDDKSTEPHKVILAWFASQGSRPADVPTDTLTVLCLRWVLRSVERLAQKHRVLLAAGEDREEGSAAAGLTVCTAGEDMLLIAQDSKPHPGIQAWNAACRSAGHSHKELVLDDIILAKDAGCDHHDIMAHFMAVAHAPASECGTLIDKLCLFRPRCFQVELEKPQGTSLGLQVKTKPPCDFGLVIREVQGGVINDWNAVNPHCEVRVGQIIVAVCGQRGTSQLLLHEIVKVRVEALCLTIIDPVMISI